MPHDNADPVSTALSPATPPVAVAAEGARVLDGGDTAEGADRRRTPRRRLRDRIASLDTTDNPVLRHKYELQNLLLLVDDDLRQTALALGAVEAFLGKSAALLARPDVGADELSAHADDEDVLDRMDALGENLDNLRHRLGLIARSL